jgi:hypothetical protein
MRAITVSVDYADLLKYTLPRNADHFDEVLVVTAPRDEETKRVVSRVSNARCYETEAFYAQGAKFNKGAAMEEGFDVLGRHGWICIFDADTMLPNVLSWPEASGCIYSPHRRMCVDPTKDLQAALAEQWERFAVCPDREPAGYCQIFHADDPALVRKRPWYGTHWEDARGCDSTFSQHWPRKRWSWLQWQVCHLGECTVNWGGRVSPRVP